MRKVILFLVLFMIGTSASLWARPEVIEVKNRKTRARETKAKQTLQQFDLSRIEDPDTRQALEAIIEALGVSRVKKA